MTTTDLIEALVKLCDNYPTAEPMTAYNVVYDLMAMYRKDVQWPSTDSGYSDLIYQVQNLLWQHYKTRITADCLEDLLGEMNDLEENANE